MEAALNEAQRGMAAREVPIGCVIARQFGSRVTIVARGFNRVNGLQRRNAHAEIVAFENAGIVRSTGRARLPLSADNAILISTLEPCVMCLGAAMEAGFTDVIFGLHAPADNGTQRVRPPLSPESTSPRITGGILADRSYELFVKWLRDNENSEQAKFVRQLIALNEKAAASSRT